MSSSLFLYNNEWTGIWTYFKGYSILRLVDLLNSLPSKNASEYLKINIRPLVGLV